MQRPLIELRHVNVHLRGRAVLRDVTWSLHAGEQWAIVGPNGAGKSTFLRVVRGDQWIDPDGGTRRYALERGDESAGAARESIGYVSPELQERYVRLDLPLRGRELVATGFDDAIYPTRVLAGAQAARLDALLVALGLEGLADKPLGRCSFGELRRLLVARALVRGPRVLVLDEFGSGIDRRAKAELLTLLERAAAETHLVCASHRASDFIPAIDRRAVMRDGRIVEAGPFERPARGSRRAPPAAPAVPPNAGELLIAIRGATVVRGGAGVLQNLDVEIRRGEHVAILGPNGSGKSTLASLIAGTLPAAYGAAIERFGERGPFDIWKLKTRIAHVCDQIQVDYDVDISVRSVIASGFHASIGLFRPPDAQQRAVVEGLIERLGIEALAARRFLALSFGERRKVLIARALVRPPELLILDEVASGLDAEFRTALEALLHEIAEAGATVVVISHHEEDIPAFVARRLHLQGGRILA